MACCDKSRSKSNVKLGFAEDGDARLLTSKFFPSKVGGKPAWLSLDHLLEANDLMCGLCGGPSTFLIQVYAPLKSDTCFHRTIFIFGCCKESCSSGNSNKNFKAFRSQLPLNNEFYSSVPPDEDDLDTEVESDLLPISCQLCHICGVKSSKKCAKCKKIYYCSKDHQIWHWKNGHKLHCDDIAASPDDAKVELLRKTADNKDCGLLFKEFDLVTEDEVEQPSPTKGKSDSERMEEYKMMMDALKKRSSPGKEQFSDEELENVAVGETNDDKQFLAFKKKIEPEPTQVLRYCRGSEPLWVSSFHKPSDEDIPNCQCGAKRIFEFQVMPQLLHYLKAESLDWGTLCIYTCADSCDIESRYQEEFLWKQNFHNDKSDFASV